MIDNPDRRKFVSERLVNRPLDEAEVAYWFGVLEGQRYLFNQGEPSTLDRHEIAFVDKRLKDTPRDQIAGGIRHSYIMNLWDREHRDPSNRIPIDPDERKPYFRPTDQGGD